MNTTEFSIQRTRPLSDFLIDEQKKRGGTGAFSHILIDISVVGKIISREVNRAGLSNIMGTTDGANASGDTVATLDVIANNLFKQYMTNGGHVAAMASEEEEGIVNIPEGIQSEYIVAFDPLDGSSNIDSNNAVGTIFSIRRRKTAPGTPATEADFLQPGHEQVAAGYIMYGSSTVLVYSSGNGVHGFTLEPEIGEWFLSHEQLQLPAGRTPEGEWNIHVYSANEAYFTHWDDASKQFLADFKNTNPRCAGRHVGALIADIHRNLIKGGIHLRPYDNYAEKKAKLRVVYELHPISFVIAQAGGYGSTGMQDVLALTPASLHERAPFVAGPADIVKEYEQQFIQTNG